MNFRFGQRKVERVAREGLERRLESLERVLDDYRCPVHGERLTFAGGELRGCCDRAQKDAVALVEGRGPGAGAQ